MGMINQFCYVPYNTYICSVKQQDNMRTKKDNYYAVSIGTYYLSSFYNGEVGWTALPMTAMIFKDYNKAYSYVRKLRKLSRYSCVFVDRLKENEWASWAWNQITSYAM